MAPVKAVIFDFGGVLAEEGFKLGMEAIGEKSGVKDLFEIADRLIYEIGYVTGKVTEAEFWNVLREKTGITWGDERLRREILGRFTLKKDVLDYVREIKSAGFITAILSDQTNWLDELDRRRPFKRLFDYVFNSFHLKKGKRDPSLFGDALEIMGVRAAEALFVDDREDNIERALGAGLQALRFRDAGSFKREMRALVGI